VIICQRILLKFFPVSEPRPDSGALSSRRSHIRCK